MMENQKKQAPIVSVKNLYKSYVAKNGQLINALRGISLDIYPGEVLGLLGPNGAGKTTIASIIATLIPPSSGEILFQGMPALSFLNDYRRIIGFCPQSPNLHADLTIEENLFYAAKAYGIDSRVAKENTNRLIKRYGLEKYKDYSIKDLSGGYRQRASIAKALVHSPSIILFDEPTVGLDPHIRKELWEEIKELRKLGIAIILTTHYLDEAELLSDKICVLTQGQVKFLGTPKELLGNSKEDSFQSVLSELFKE